MFIELCTIVSILSEQMRGGRGRSDSNSAMLTRPTKRRWHNTQHFNKITGNDDSRSVKTSTLMNGWQGINAATFKISRD